MKAGTELLPRLKCDFEHGGFSLKNKALISLLLSMVIFGTVGIFRRYIPFPSGFIAFLRGLIGFIFLFAALKIRKTPFSINKTGKKGLLLCLSGALMGFNWILLFEAYNYTSVAAATLCYYMAPVFVIIASPFIFGEKLGGKKILCVFAAVIGMLFVSGIFEHGIDPAGEMKGIFLALGAALLYAAVVIMNKKLPEVPAFEKTVIQLGSAAATILPYTLFAEDLSTAEISPVSVTMLITVGILHTGIAYALYFGSIGNLPAQTAAIFSYIDPVTAILLSAFLLGEELSAFGIIGAVLILGGAVLSESRIFEKQEKEN